MAENEKKTDKPANDTDRDLAKDGAEDESAAYKQPDEEVQARETAGPLGGEDAVDVGPADRPDSDNAGEESIGESIDHVEEDISSEFERIRELEHELSSLKDSALRAMADAENVRKRAEREIADARKYGPVPLARDLLSVSDNLRRALEATPEDQIGDNELLKNLRAGVDMVEKELQDALKKAGVKEVTPELGEKFDPNLHQAMFEMPTGEHPPGTVAQVVQAGYVLHDRLLRAAMVGVAKAPPQNDSGGGDGGGGDAA